MLSIIGLASPSSQTRVSRSTTAGFAIEVTATPELSEESWTASSPSPSPCFGIKPSTTLRSERTLTRAQRRFPLDQEWGVHSARADRGRDLVGTEASPDHGALSPWVRRSAANQFCTTSS